MECGIYNAEEKKKVNVTKKSNKKWLKMSAKLHNDSRMNNYIIVFKCLLKKQDKRSPSILFPTDYNERYHIKSHEQ